MTWCPSIRGIASRMLTLFLRPACAAWAVLNGLATWSLVVSLDRLFDAAHATDWRLPAQIGGLMLPLFLASLFVNTAAGGIAFLGSRRTRVGATSSLRRAFLRWRVLLTALGVSGLVTLAGVSLGTATLGILVLTAPTVGHSFDVAAVCVALGMLGGQAVCCTRVPSACALDLETRGPRPEPSGLRPSLAVAVAAHLSVGAPVLLVTYLLFHVRSFVPPVYEDASLWVGSAVWSIGAVGIYALLGAAIFLERSKIDWSPEMTARIFE